MLKLRLSGVTGATKGRSNAALRNCGLKSSVLMLFRVGRAFDKATDVTQQKQQNPRRISWASHKLKIDWVAC